MDLTLNATEYYLFALYISPATDLLIIINLSMYNLYSFFATLSYYFIMHSAQPVPWISIPIFPPFLLEVRGYSKLYDGIGEFPYGWFQLTAGIFTFLFFTDMLIYWIHKGFHQRLVLTSFVSHAFHLLDDVLQSLPYHRYPFMFPLHMVVYLGSYILALIINGSTLHTDYHMLVDYSYGQYFTLWDRTGALFKNPSSFEGNGPLSYVRMTRRKQKSCRKCL
ncbi:hypothetical protein FD755_007414 [Muntiacus reevesi]|uniref:Fatty acid hydroxylase domain-containing protein n=1 Tax=Muntiacus reevesi TaxID=9886 RepID=A0A5J5MHJ8_MUNRE|nr:hypothetical protein FD755_007414 [Muntiacus reevesi]